MYILVHVVSLGVWLEGALALSEDWCTRCRGRGGAGAAAGPGGREPGRSWAELVES